MSRFSGLGAHESHPESPLTAYAISGIFMAVRNCAMKELVFLGDSHRILAAFPDPVQRHVGFALYQAQMGNKHPDAKPLKGLPAGVLEVVSDHRGDTFRAVYTVRLEHAVYVLHAFQKKSKQGIATPQSEIDRVKQRLRRAMEIDREREA